MKFIAALVVLAMQLACSMSGNGSAVAGTPTRPKTQPRPGTGEMVLIPAGNFDGRCYMDGVTANSACSSGDSHGTVYLDAYRIDKYEVTNAQYAQCVAAGGCTLPWNSWLRSTYYDLPEYANYPVRGVGYKDANDYCTWAGKYVPNGNEWEKAARGSNDTRNWPWGNQLPD
jgi:eukaryotic-like serine/threonine-protein kinase